MRGRCPSASSTPQRTYEPQQARKRTVSRFNSRAHNASLLKAKTALIAGGRLTYFSRRAPIEILYILLRIVLTPTIDESFISHAWLIGELDPVLLIDICNSFADCRLP